MTVAAVVAGCGSRPGSPSGSSPPQPAGLTGHAPSVDTAAFAGHGELAFVSRAGLWALDGVTGTLRLVASASLAPGSPVSSPDGRWLAYAAGGHSATGYAVWLALGDGSGAREILASGGPVGWSPVSDVLAVVAGNTIRLVWPNGSSRTLLDEPGMGWAAWSPDGRSLAVSTSTAAAGTLTSYPVSGGSPAVWLRLSARGGMNYLIDLAGWGNTGGSAFGPLATAHRATSMETPCM